MFHHDVKEGTIPLEDGVLLNQKARDLMASAVLSTISKRKHFSGARPPEATSYLDSLRLGQTEIGSYVVNVIAPSTPVPVDLETIPLPGLSTLVTANLTASLEALSGAIDAYEEQGDLSVFDKAIERGASANMCDALVGLSGSQKQRGFEISIAPSIHEQFRLPPKTFVFEPEGVARLAAASEYYKDNYVLPDRTITGVIKRLDRPADEEWGTITVTAHLGEIEKNVIVELGKEDYLDAITAHRAKEVVQVAGDLHVTARTARLLNPVGFRVLRAGDLF
ncbi:hypothetical protein J7E62_24750 [Variovorax paradoxus]|nr:hypothetical protein [Variovorax paradoxus]